MKKSILAVAGVAAVAGIAMPVAGAFATDPVDTVKITIADSCTISYGSTAHANGSNTGDGAINGTWGDGTTNKPLNTMAVTMKNGSAEDKLGTVTLKAICNDHDGYKVVLTPTALTGATDGETIPYITSAAAPTSSNSAWGVSDGETTATWFPLATSGDNTTSVVVKDVSSATAGTEFSLTYGASVDSTQAADTYTGTASYTITHPGTATD